MCAQVMNRLSRFYHTRKVQPFSPYEAAQLGGAEMDESRRRLAAMMGAQNDEISIGPSTTQNSYVLAQAFGQMLNAGDSIIVTNKTMKLIAGRGADSRSAALKYANGKLTRKRGSCRLMI